MVCEGGVSLLLIAPSAEEKTKWMEGIEIMLIGGYKRKKEQLADPLSASATEKVLLFLLSCMCVVHACVLVCVHQFAGTLSTCFKTQLH